MNDMQYLETKYGKKIVVFYKKATSIIKRNSKTSLVLAVLLLAFAWFELRPIYVHNKCDNIAVDDATELLKSKIKLEGISSYERGKYKDTLDAGMHYVVDYDRYYKRCLQRYGLGK